MIVVDCVIYDEDCPFKPPSGIHLGQLKDEIPGKYISDFVATAAKSYSLELTDETTGEKEIVTKHKGFVNVPEVRHKINHQSMIKMVDAYVQKGEVMVIETERETIQKDKYRQLTNIVLKKRFMLSTKKRIICDDYYCMPFGYDFS